MIFVSKKFLLVKQRTSYKIYNVRLFSYQLGVCLLCFKVATTVSFFKLFKKKQKKLVLKPGINSEKHKSILIDD